MYNPVCRAHLAFFSSMACEPSRHFTYYLTHADAPALGRAHSMHLHASMHVHRHIQLCEHPCIYICKHVLPYICTYAGSVDAGCGRVSGSACGSMFPSGEFPLKKTPRISGSESRGGGFTRLISDVRLPHTEGIQNIEIENPPPRF